MLILLFLYIDCLNSRLQIKIFKNYKALTRNYEIIIVKI